MACHSRDYSWYQQVGKTFDICPTLLSLYNTLNPTIAIRIQLCKGSCYLLDIILHVLPKFYAISQGIKWTDFTIISSTRPWLEYKINLNKVTFSWPNFTHGIYYFTNWWPFIRVHLLIMIDSTNYSSFNSFFHILKAENWKYFDI